MEHLQITMANVTMANVTMVNVTMVNVSGEIDSLCEIYSSIIEFSAESSERFTIVLCEIK